MDKKYKLVLFDLDGTIMDSQEGILHSVEYTIKQLGLELPKHVQLNTFIGPPIEFTFEQVFALEKSELKKAATIFRKTYQSQYLYEATLYPGILDLLNDLKDNGIKSGIATNKRESYTLKLLKHFNLIEVLDVIHGTDDAGTLSKADLIKKCADDLNISLNDVLMVGDTVHDANAAHLLGVDFLPVTYGYGFITREELISNPYITVCEKSEGLKDIILKQDD